MQRSQGPIQDRGAAVILGAAGCGVGGACITANADQVALCLGAVLGAAAWGSLAGERGGAASGVSP